MSETKYIVFFTKYSDTVPVSRCRSYRLTRALEDRGLTCRHYPLYSSPASKRWYRTGKDATGLTLLFAVLKRFLQLFFSKKNAIAVVEYPLLPGASYHLQKWLLRKQNRMVADLLYASPKNIKQDGNRNPLLSSSHLVITPDPVLTKRMLAIADNVTELPPCVDIKRYTSLHPASMTAEEKNVFRIGWTGTALTTHHLLMIKDCLRQLHELYHIKLVLIGFDKKREKELQGLPYIIETRDTTDTEISLLKTCDVAVVPLANEVAAITSFYTVIQYMACGLPFVASSNEVTIAANHGNDNLFARTPFEWYSCLAAMIQNKDYYKEVGAKNARTADTFYSVEKTQTNYLSLLESMVQS